jgi:hypothetical protein
MTTVETQIDSIRGLARLLNRAHTTVGAWLRRDDWPFRPAPPWPLGIVSAIEEWAEDHLQEDRNADQARRPDVKVAAPGFTLTGHDIASERTPFHLRPHLTPEQYGTLTMADFDAFAHAIVAAFKVLLADRAEAIGEGDLLDEGSPAYFARLMPDADDAEQNEKLGRYLNIVFCCWMDKRFTGTPGYEPLLPPTTRKGRKS